MSVRKISRKISRTGPSPGGKTLLKIELKKKEINMQILRLSEELKLEAITSLSPI